MNKTALWIVVAVVILAGIIYFMSGSASPTSDTQPTSTPTVLPTTTSDNTLNTQPAPSSLKELVALKSSQKCEFSDAGSDGVFYVANGKARGDFTTTSDGKSVQGHMMMDGTDIYVWTEGQAQGFKMTADSSTQGASATQSQGVDANKKMDYTCEAWTADTAMFSLPTGMQFMDIKAMMPTQ